MQINFLLILFVFIGVQIFGDSATSNAELNIRAQKGINIHCFTFTIMLLTDSSAVTQYHLVNSFFSCVVTGQYI